MVLGCAARAELGAATSNMGGVFNKGSVAEVEHAVQRDIFRMDALIRVGVGQIERMCHKVSLQLLVTKRHSHASHRGSDAKDRLHEKP